MKLGVLSSSFVFDSDPIDSYFRARVDARGSFAVDMAVSCGPRGRRLRRVLPSEWHIGSQPKPICHLVERRRVGAVVAENGSPGHCAPAGRRPPGIALQDGGVADDHAHCQRVESAPHRDVELDDADCGRALLAIGVVAVQEASPQLVLADTGPGVSPAHSTVYPAWLISLFSSTTVQHRGRGGGRAAGPFTSRSVHA